jgi:hypothetical protein
MKKIAIFGLIISASFISNTTEISPHLEEYLMRRLGNLPSDSTKTPTSPDIIEHQPNIKGPDRSFHRKRIYFGTDKEGNPCYRSLYEHEKNNPEFSNVNLVLFHEAAWYKLRFQDSFEEIGIYGDKEVRNRLRSAIAANGGVWCPELNTIIGGSREIGKTPGEQCICERFTEFLNQPEQPSKFSKVK